MVQPFRLLYLFDTADEVDEAEAEQYLSKLTAGEFSPLMYESKATARSEFAQFRQMFLLIGGILCAIIGLVGLLNFFNAMMTGILSRRREFAVLQAVGMTNRQLKNHADLRGIVLRNVLRSSGLYSVAGGGTSCRKNAGQYVLVL